MSKNDLPNDAPVGELIDGKFVWNTEGGPDEWRKRQNYNGKLYAKNTAVVPKEAIEKLLTDAMDTAVANGADSRSMPDEYVAIAAWICEIPSDDTPFYDVEEEVRSLCDELLTCGMDRCTLQRALSKAYAAGKGGVQ